MKKNLLWRSLLVMAVSATLGTGFASCNDDDDDPYKDHPIVGTWVNKYETSCYTYTFNADGTFTYLDEDDNPIHYHKTLISGTYKVKGNLLTLTEDKERKVWDESHNMWYTDQNPYGGETYSYTISIDEDKMYFYDDEDTEMKKLWWTYVKK